MVSVVFVARVVLNDQQQRVMVHHASWTTQSPRKHSAITRRLEGLWERCARPLRTDMCSQLSISEDGGLIFVVAISVSIIFVSDVQWRTTYKIS